MIAQYVLGETGPHTPTSLPMVARRIRELVVRAVFDAQGGHLGAPLSAADLLANLYFKELRVDPLQPLLPSRDRFVLSKGHASIGLYATLALRGFFPVSELGTFDRAGSRLQGHPDMTLLPGVDMSTGSLGLGFSAAVGIAIGLHRDASRSRVYALLGDGECQEGIVWEAADIAARYRLSNLVGIVDANGLQQYGWRAGDGSRQPPIECNSLADRFRAFGWCARVIDGHDQVQISEALMWARSSAGPAMIVARTTKGRGVSFMEGDYAWHSRVPTEAESLDAIAELRAASL